jgi:hypothetical protein
MGAILLIVCRCIIDAAPRTFDTKSCSVLANMAEMVVREIEREKVLAMQLAANNSKDHEALIRAIDSYRYGVCQRCKMFTSLIWMDILMLVSNIYTKWPT